MYRGFVLRESLVDPAVLDSLETIYVAREKHNDPNYPSIWHLYKVRLTDENIGRITKKLSEIMKAGWYCHFWNENNVYVVYENQIFKIPREKKWSSHEFQECKRYGMEHGIDEKYLDFWLQEEDSPRK